MNYDTQKYGKQFQNAITYEISSNRHVHTRKVLTFFDRLAVVGGLAGALVPFFSALVVTFHYRS